MKSEDFDNLITAAFEAHAVAQKRAEASMRKLLEDDRRRKGACAKCGANMLRSDYKAVTVLKCPLGHTQRYIPRSDVS